MAKDKKDIPAEAVSADDAELKARKADEEAALDRVCKAMGIDPRAVREKESAEPEQLYSYDLGELGGELLMVNGEVIPQRGTCNQHQIDLYREMAGKVRMRKLREKIGNNYEIASLAGGGISARKLGQVSE